MSNIFEQPWTLLIAAIFVLLVMLFIRPFFPEKRRRWHLAMPALLVLTAFGLDFFVRTDLEKINTLIETGLRAVEAEDTDAIEGIISADYSDRHHKSKELLMRYCRALLSEVKIEKNKKLDLQIEISAPTATALLKVLTRFDEQSIPYEQFGKHILISKLKLYFTKGRDKRWLIKRAELLEINNQPVDGSIWVVNKLSGRVLGVS